MNVLILMAGSDDAFRQAGYVYPKNLTEIAGLPLAQRVIDGLSSLHSPNNRFIFLLRGDENRQSYTGAAIQLLLPDATIVEVPGITAGAACTALLAIDQINSEQPLLIVNGDQIIERNIAEIVEDFQRRRLDGGITVFEAVHPRWSYAKCDERGLVIETAEKRPISKLATAGMYYFVSGRSFVSAVISMIKKDANVDGAFYVCPVYNELILQQARIGVFKIPRSTYFSLANPQSVQAYEEYLRVGIHREAL